jgi:hypothetical protein
MIYVKKSPGAVNFGEAISSLLAYVYRKYGSSSMFHFGPDIRKQVARRHICGGIIKRYSAPKMTHSPGIYLV